MVGSAVKTMVLSSAAAKPRMQRARRMVQKVQSWRTGPSMGLEVNGRGFVVEAELRGTLEASTVWLALASSTVAIVVWATASAPVMENPGSFMWIVDEAKEAEYLISQSPPDTTELQSTREFREQRTGASTALHFSVALISQIEVFRAASPVKMWICLVFKHTDLKFLLLLSRLGSQVLSLID